jgi:hypothetical protein
MTNSKSTCFGEITEGRLKGLSMKERPEARDNLFFYNLI